MLNFNVGEKYSRRDVQVAAGCPEARGGPWYTGVVRIPRSTDFVIFANVGDAGRTGHDYQNCWEGGLARLRWYHQTGSRFQHPRVQALLRRDTRVHVFWRASNKNPRFVYRGLATPVEVNKNSSPVEIIWSF